MLSELRLKHFRSYKNDSFEFGPGVNIIVGPNASGKTNLLEAILVLARGGSYRAKDAELVQFEASWARLDARLENGSERSVKLVHDPVLSKNYEVDGKPYKRLNLKSSLPVVLFEPNHLRLLSGAPQNRRNYLDDLLEQLQTGYGRVRREYVRTLAQRNALLKRTDLNVHTQLFPWNIRLSQLAGQIVRARKQLASDILSVLPELYSELSNAVTRVALSYDAQWATDQYETRLLQELENSEGLDKQRGFTSSGPHREDLLVVFDDHPAPVSASRGEARTLVLALKIIELQLLEVARETTPLLLLDDVFSELDGKRRHALTKHLSSYQSFITTTDADIVLQHFTEACTVIALG